LGGAVVETSLAMGAGNTLKTNRQKLLCVVLMCFGFSLVYAAAQTQPAAGPPATVPTTPEPSTKASATPLPDPQTPQEFFARARQMIDLEASGIPFHFKATYVASGDTESTGNGTYEEWWQSKDLWRKEATLGDYRYVEIQNGEKHSIYGSWTYVPLRIREVMGQQLSHLGSSKERADWKFSARAEGSEVQEIATQEHPCGSRFKDFVCTREIEFTKRGWLHSYRVDDLSESFTDYQPFGDLYFPMKMALTLRGDVLLTAEVVTLENILRSDPGAIDTRIPADLHAASLPVEDAAAKDVSPPKLIHAARMKYPQSERKSHPNRVVVVACTLDATGAVREPYVLLSDGTEFDQAAMDAVRQYRFRPAMKGGVPAMADVHLVMDFRYRLF
jgi:TonB family protein